MTFSDYPKRLQKRLSSPQRNHLYEGSSIRKRLGNRSNYIHFPSNPKGIRNVQASWVHVQITVDYQYTRVKNSRFLSPGGNACIQNMMGLRFRKVYLIERVTSNLISHLGSNNNRDMCVGMKIRNAISLQARKWKTWKLQRNCVVISFEKQIQTSNYWKAKRVLYTDLR